MNQQNKDVLPDGMVEWIESATSSRVVNIEAAVGAGVSREGAYISLNKEGESLEAYLAFDVRRADDPARSVWCRREASAPRLAEKHGLRAPRVLASWPEQRAILTRRLYADVSLDNVDSDTLNQIAEDYVGEIVKLHRIPVEGLNLDGFGEPESVDAWARERTAFLRMRHSLNGSEDPLFLLIFHWLEKNLPTGDDIPTVVVHGDVGAANFLHDGKKVKAVLDWEQSHYGDPMEDFAMFSLRGALFPFVPLPMLLKSYERQGGHPVDLKRIRYYRTLVTMGSLNDMHGQLVQSNEPFAGNVGKVFAYYFALLTLVVKGLAEAEGVTPEPMIMPEVQVRQWDRLYDLVQNEIENNIAPRCSDAAAGHRASSMVQVIRYWQGREKYGAAFDAAECAEIGAVLGSKFDSLQQARSALADAIRAESIAMPDAIQLCCSRVAREIEAARAGLGPLADSQYPPLR
jgi:aminoglycoside phosphotransferase (APT) family kinase protein